MAISYSTYFNGSTDSLTTPSNAAFAFGTGSFTVEMWFKKTGGSAQQCLMGGTSNQPEFEFDSNAGNSKLRIFDGANDVMGSTTIQNNVWYHVAWVRNSSNFRVYLNGVSEASVTSSTDYTSTQFRIGQRLGGTTGFTGYISNLRVVKGSAVYTGAFVPTTSPLTAISGTSLLTCQSATTVDNSTNGFSLTVAGSPIIANTDTPFVTYTVPTGYGLTVPSTTLSNPLSSTITQGTSSSLLTINTGGVPAYYLYTPSTTLSAPLSSTITNATSAELRILPISAVPPFAVLTPTLGGGLVKSATFIHTSDSPITISAAAATISQTWTIS